MAHTTRPRFQLNRNSLLALAASLLLVLSACNEPASQVEDDLDQVTLGAVEMEFLGGLSVTRLDLTGTATLTPQPGGDGPPIVRVEASGTASGVDVDFVIQGALPQEEVILVPQTPHPFTTGTPFEELSDWTGTQPVIHFLPRQLHVNPRTEEVFVPGQASDLFVLRYWPPEDNDGQGEFGFGGLMQMEGWVPGSVTESGQPQLTNNALSVQFVLRVPLVCSELAC